LAAWRYVNAIALVVGGFENIEMKAKHDDDEGERKLSYKNKLYDD